MTNLKTTPFLLIGLCFLSILWACGDDSPVDGPTINSCGLNELNPGVTATENEAFHVTLLAASPLPAEQFLNDWQVEITDKAGAPITELEDFVMDATMPGHSHGTETAPVLSKTDMPGVFKIDAINLWMEGIWEVRFRTPEQTDGDAAVIEVCIPKL